MLESLLDSLRPTRQRLLEHPIYRQIQTLDDLRIFMEHHVFAVWDFMSLLKVLQSRLTCLDIPWVPQGDRLCRRLINEIVLAEESDLSGEIGYASHFELYHNAMKACGANVSGIDGFLERIRKEEPLAEALRDSAAPPDARKFVLSTWQTIQTGSIHRIAAAFTLGREELIPDVFRALIKNLDRCQPRDLALFEYYLDRHIHLDEEHHRPMALQMLSVLCGDDPRKWREAEESAALALDARISLWNGILQQIESAHVFGERERIECGSGFEESASPNVRS